MTYPRYVKSNSGPTSNKFILPEDATKYLDGTGAFTVPPGTATGDVVGPASSTDNAIARYDGTTGKLIQNSDVIVSDKISSTTTISVIDNIVVSATGTALLQSGGNQCGISNFGGFTPSGDTDVSIFVTSGLGKLIGRRIDVGSNLPVFLLDTYRQPATAGGTEVALDFGSIPGQGSTIFDSTTASINIAASMGGSITLTGTNAITNAYIYLARTGAVTSGPITSYNYFGIIAVGASFTTLPTNIRGLRVPNVGVAGVTTSAAISLGSQSGSTNPWAITSDGGSSYHVGNFRIGSTVAPTVALDVTGAAAISANLTMGGYIGLFVTDTDGATEGFFWYDNSEDRLKFFTGAVTRTVVDDGTTGDVTFAAGVATIPNDTVTFAKFQNITSDRLLGRDTAGSGDTEEITVGGGIEFTGSGGIQTSAFTGDVTKAAGGTVLTAVFDTAQNILANQIFGP